MSWYAWGGRELNSLHGSNCMAHAARFSTWLKHKGPTNLGGDVSGRVAHAAPCRNAWWEGGGRKGRPGTIDSKQLTHNADRHAPIVDEQLAKRG